MAWIQVLRQGEDEDTSGVQNLFSLRPELVRARRAFADTSRFTGDSGLGRYREELIAVSIAALLHCRY